MWFSIQLSETKHGSRECNKPAKERYVYSKATYDMSSWLSKWLYFFLCHYTGNAGIPYDFCAFQATLMMIFSLNVCITGTFPPQPSDGIARTVDESNGKDSRKTFMALRLLPTYG
jgi:hypothetical protein